MSGSTEKREFWSWVLSEHAGSGLSVRNFCRREGLSEPSFYQWRKKLITPSEVKGDDSADIKVDTRASDRHAFLPVRVLPAEPAGQTQSRQQPDPVRIPARQADQRIAIEIRTPTGYEIKFFALPAKDVIQQAVLAVNEAASC